MRLADEIYELTIHLNGTYPGYKEWFYDKQIKGCLTPNRNIIFIKNEEEKIIALSCLKKMKKKRKYVHYLFQTNIENKDWEVYCLKSL